MWQGGGGAGQGLVVAAGMDVVGEKSLLDKHVGSLYNHFCKNIYLNLFR